MTQVIINDILPLTQTIAGAGQTVYSTNWTANYPSDVVVYSRSQNTAADDATQILPYPSAYSVAFIGDQQIVQVTLVTPSTQFDVVTITRMTPADRENLYTNTNFTPSMLNNDFGILTLVDQQAQLVNQQVAPRYNYSAFIDVPVDTILPILGPNETWVKNNNNDEIITFELPQNGIAPADNTYITLTDETNTLPNSFPFSAIGAGIVVNVPGSTTVITREIVGTSNQITVSNGTAINANPVISIPNNAIFPGTGGIGIPEGNIVQRVIPSLGISLRYNTDMSAMEYWDGVAWTQVAATSFTGTVTNIETSGLVTGGPITTTGTISLAEIASNTIVGNVTGGDAVPVAIAATGSGSPVLNTSPTIITPVITTIDDVNGNTTLALASTVSAVNHITVSNQSTGVPPGIAAGGTDTNVGLNLYTQGTGPLTIITGATINPVTIQSGTNVQHTTHFAFSDTNEIRNIIFPDETGTVALVKAPTIQQFTSGSGTYTLPSGCLYIDVELTGGGSGGAGGGTGSPGTGTTGTDTTFGSLTGSAGSTAGSAGGTASGGDLNVPGMYGSYSTSISTSNINGGIGGATPIGHGGQGGGGNGAGITATGYGAGGQGGGAATAGVTGGIGGPSAGYVRKRITSPSGTYSYSVGAAGTGGVAGTNGQAGGNGAPGIITVYEYYN